MSKLDLTLTGEVWPELNKMNKELIDVNDTLMNPSHRDSSKLMESDLEIWREIFKEDQVKIHGCRCGCR
ncbi:hypothetical protein [Sulfurovum sp. TSL1]|uniref:hypothetical protein n=1 Tax=Sulfurovum sp. TSL1 TaxID=2826994 RepID=UPI001CC35F7D|nr:hypothetical protein [Sulfurovum sp. TSL1]GIT97331.1 hypothetical protein TSL1_01520 [Sulfurovum sp. TSL1]